MSRIHVEASRIVDAPADAVYQFLRDYRERHPSILPPESFLGYTVEAGGVGADTVVSFRIRAGGRERFYRMHISEPDPGRVLQEQDTESSLTTTFTMTPVEGDARTNVRIATWWQGGGGIGGFFERTFAPTALRGIYSRELDRLAAALKEQ